MIPKVYIESDFTDYYDILSTKDSSAIKYVRKYSDSVSKGRAIHELTSLGIRTIEIGTVRDMATRSKVLVVYTDPKKHNGEGKLVMEAREAVMMYPNSLASPFYVQTPAVTTKFLQVGSRRFRLLLENIDTVRTGNILDYDELPYSYNPSILLPIFSIDYISTIHGMVAIDFNKVQNLQSIGIQNILRPEEVIGEVYNALIMR